MRNRGGATKGHRMALARVAWIVALFIVGLCDSAWAQDVTLTSRDGGVEVSGNLLGFDGEYYRVDTVFGELTVDGSGVSCTGPGCPNLENYVARVTLSGAPTIGRVLVPALIGGFASKNGYTLQRDSLPENRFRYSLLDSASNNLMGEFTVVLTNTDEGFADLLANEADIAMALREVRDGEIQMAKASGLGDLSITGRSRLLALDALVPVVAAGNPVQTITTPQLARVLAGQIQNWAEIGGPDAPIAVHLHDPRSGLGQATLDHLLKPLALEPTPGAVPHLSAPTLIAAVQADPFALGVTARSERQESGVLALTGECRFAMQATPLAVKTEDYPLAAPLFIYLPARRFPKIIREFLSYLRDPSAQLVIRRAGFVDQLPEEIGIDAQGNRFANAIARAGSEIKLDELQRMIGALMPLKRLTTTYRFEAGSTKLDAQSRANIQQLAHALEQGKFDARRLVFVGFSDGDGSAAINQNIARQRANAVRQAVISAAETADLSRVQLEIEAFGEAMPMACDDSTWGRRVNRRVEVWVR